MGIKEHHPRVGDGIFDISIKVAMNTASSITSITNIIVSLALVVVSVVVVVRTRYEAP